MTRISGRRLLAGAGALALAGCAASPYYATPSKKAFLPAEGKPQRTGEVRLSPKDVLFETPVGYRVAARLTDPVTVDVIGKHYAFAAGELLVATELAGTAAAQVPAGSRVMCGTAQLHTAKNLVALATLGMSSVANRTGGSTQFCLIDSDRDEKVDKAILVGVKKAADAAPVTIAPARYTVVRDQPLDGESVARIVYDGKPGKLKGNVDFELKVVEGGSPLYFQNGRTRANIAKLPQQVELMGTVFTVKSYNPADGSVVVDAERGFQPGEYGITVTTTTTYIPIYVPR